MRTLLINPNTPDYCDIIGWSQYFPLGLGYIAAVLEKHHDVEVIDVGAEGLGDVDLRRIVSNRRPEIVGITSTTPAFQGAIEIAQTVKEVNKDIVVVVGGAHSNAMPAYPLRYSYFDISVYGEGERTAVELWDRIEKGEPYDDVRGIAFRERKRIVVTPRREFIENLDELPFPARHLFPMTKYPRSAHLSVDPTYTVGTSRGCPFSCAFCSNNVAFGRKYRFRSATNVVDEIQLLVSQCDAKGIYFREDIFTANRQRVLDTCNEIVKRGLDIKWEAEVRVDTIDEEMLQAMKRAGCEVVWGGFESGSQRILDYLNKQITVSQVRKACNLCNEVGIKIGASFMIGIPGETMDEIQQTIDLAKELYPKVAWEVLGIFLGYPTSKLYELIKESKLYEEEINHGLLIVKTAEFNWRILSEIKQYASTWIKRDKKIDETQGVTLKLLPAILSNTLQIRDDHQLEVLQAEHSRLPAQVQRLQKKLNSSMEEAWKVKTQLRALKDSFSYRLGNVLVQAVYRPGRNTILLPYRLIRLCAAGFKNWIAAVLP